MARQEEDEGIHQVRDRLVTPTRRELEQGQDCRVHFKSWSPQFQRIWLKGVLEERSIYAEIAGMPHFFPGDELRASNEELRGENERLCKQVRALRKAKEEAP